MQQRAIVLLSGGIDSTTCLAIAKQCGYECYALAIDYGQKHRVELKAAKKIAEQFACAEFRIANISLGAMPGAALTDEKLNIPKHSKEKTIKSTYFPARNTLFLSLALAWAESIMADKIFFGANLADYHGFPDTRPDYLLAFAKMAKLATKAGRESQQNLSIETPLITMDKKAILARGLALGIDYSMTVTCYQAKQIGEACGQCDACAIRREAYAELGMKDDVVYLA